MKLLIGKDLGSYEFDPVTSSITITNTPVFTLEQFLLITHVSSGTIIYNFADSAKGGLLGVAPNTNVLYLDYDCSALSDTELQIWMWIPIGVQEVATTYTFVDGNPTEIVKVIEDVGTVTTTFVWSNGFPVSSVTTFTGTNGAPLEGSILGEIILPFTLGA